MAELLAAYTDKILRKGGNKQILGTGSGNGGNDQMFDELLGKIVQVFTHLIDKDVFIEVFRSYLAKRLLNEKS
jgi:hypothetical protein